LERIETNFFTRIGANSSESREVGSIKQFILFPLSLRILYTLSSPPFIGFERKRHRKNHKDPQGAVHRTPLEKILTPQRIDCSLQAHNPHWRKLASIRALSV
jgi:hypothetical protein